MFVCFSVFYFNFFHTYGSYKGLRHPLRICLQLDFAAFFEEHQNAIFNVYFWFRVVFVHFIPCSALVLLNAALSCAMQRAKRRRQQLLKLNRRQECLRLQVAPSRRYNHNYNYTMGQKVNPIFLTCGVNKIKCEKQWFYWNFEIAYS